MDRHEILGDLTMTEFKKLSTSAKYDAIIAFCKEHNTLPYYKSEDENERQMRSFLVNKWNIQKRFEQKKSHLGIPEEELPKLAEIEKYKETTIDKLNVVLAYCSTHKNIPSYKATTEEEETVIKKMVSLKNLEHAGKLDKAEQELMGKINSYKKKSSRLDKLTKILEFCETNKRTPKQHVEDQTEKRFGEFLSIVKILSDDKLSDEEKGILEQILQYAPAPRKHRRNDLFKELLEYVTENHKAPRNSKFNAKEQDIGKFYIKLRWLNKKDKLNETEKNMFTAIENLIINGETNE